MSSDQKHGWKPGEPEALSHRARAFKRFVETCLEA
jgi:XTP/dITP diphosphohydrolase